MKIIELEQRTDEWFEYRRGKVTGSEFKRVIGRKDAEDSYRYQLIAERLMGQRESDENAATRGTRLESIAREVFIEKYGKEVHEIGMVQSDTLESFAVSPDGFIGKGYQHQLEIKCLCGWKHIKVYTEKTPLSEHYPQAIAAFIANEKLKDFTFFFYHDLMPENLQGFTVVLKREDVEADIQDYQERATRFLESVEEGFERLILS